MLLVPSIVQWIGWIECHYCMWLRSSIVSKEGTEKEKGNNHEYTKTTLLSPPPDVFVWNWFYDVNDDDDDNTDNSVSPGFSCREGCKRV
jgi:hypothetical protein